MRWARPSAVPRLEPNSTIKGVWWPSELGAGAGAGAGWDVLIGRDAINGAVTVVFVCGEAARMAPDVRRTFARVFQEHTAAAEDGQAWLAGLVASHRYLEDIWGSAPMISERNATDVDVCARTGI
jgi:hypothetical protein